MMTRLLEVIENSSKCDWYFRAVRNLLGSNVANTTSAFNLAHAFFWRGTPEGDSYWSELSSTITPNQQFTVPVKSASIVRALKSRHPKSKYPELYL